MVVLREGVRRMSDNERWDLIWSRNEITWRGLGRILWMKLRGQRPTHYVSVMTTAPVERQKIANLVIGFADSDAVQALVRAGRTEIMKGVTDE